jgi:hypothetical protein
VFRPRAKSSMIRASAAAVNALEEEPMGTSVYTCMQRHILVSTVAAHNEESMYAYLWCHFVAVFRGHTPSIIFDLMFGAKADERDRVPRSRVILEYLGDGIVQTREHASILGGKRGERCLVGECQRDHKSDDGDNPGPQWSGPHLVCGKVFSSRRCYMSKR